MTRVVVIGGGITGQMVQWFYPQATILDWSKPPTHGHLTRHWGTNYLWEPIGDIPYRPVEVITCVDGEPATWTAILRYKDKIGKEGDGSDWGRQFTHRTTGYEPLSLPTPTIQYNTAVLTINPFNRVVYTRDERNYVYDILISTIPLYAFIQMFPDRTRRQWFDLIGGPTVFRSAPIHVKVGPRPPDAPHPVEVLYVNYLSDPQIDPYRFCDRGMERHWESIRPMRYRSNGDTDTAMVTTKILRPGKLVPPYPVTGPLLNDMAKSGIFTFGRYGSWSPDELVHETFNRIRSWSECMR